MSSIHSMNIWKEEDGSRNRRDFLNRSIEELNLSVRSYNCLKRAKCFTIGDILRIMGGEGGLKKLRNLGTRSEEEILAAVEPYVHAAGEAGYSPTRRLVRPAKSMMDRRIEEFNLTESSRRELRRCGIFRVGDLYGLEERNEPGWFAVRELFYRIEAIL